MNAKLIDHPLFLKTLLSDITMFRQWYELNHIGKAHEYLIKIERLLHMLEVEDCKSIGGFSSGQSSNDRTIGKRVAFLLNKNNTELTAKDKANLNFLIRKTAI